MLTKTQINEMLYKWQYCELCYDKLDCCSDIVIVTTHGVYCPKCWGKYVREQIKISNKGDCIVNP